MAQFSEREEAFFRSGDQLSDLPAVVDDPSPTWWRWLFRPEQRAWSAPFELDPRIVIDDDILAAYEAYEVIYDEQYELAA